jgi:hypothetical protein
VGELSDAEIVAQLRDGNGDDNRRRALQAEGLRRLPPVRQLVGGGYMVASRSTPGAWWLVNVSNHAALAWDCTCPAGTPRCWHVRQVEAVGRLQSALDRRPTPPPNVSALVD